MEQRCNYGSLCNVVKAKKNFSWVIKYFFAFLSPQGWGAGTSISESEQAMSCTLSSYYHSRHLSH